MKKNKLKRQINSFLDVYHFPLKLDSFMGDIVWTSDNGRAFDFMDGGAEDEHLTPLIIQEEIVKLVNGYDDAKVKLPGKLSYKGSYIYLDDKFFISIRGWGHLTGIGGLKLKAEEATKIQDEFAAYIIEKLEKNG